MWKRLLAFTATMFMATTLAWAQQLPLPEPGPFEFPGAPGTQRQCTKEYLALLREQEKVIQQLRTTAPEQIAMVCDGMETLEGFARKAAKLMDTPEDAFLKLFEGAIGDLGRPFGIPRLDVRLLKHMCTQASGETARELTNQLGRLQAEIERCKGI